jgi:hypothetical protein
MQVDCSRFAEVGEFLPEIPKSLPPVAQPVFLFRLQLSEGFPGAFFHENRVVAESSCPRLTTCDLPGAGSLAVKECRRLQARVIQDWNAADRADELGGSLPVRQPLKGLQELPVVVGVAAVFSRKAGGIDPGSSVESINAKS